MDAEGIVLTFVGINEPGDVEGWLQAAVARNRSACRSGVLPGLQW